VLIAGPNLTVDRTAAIDDLRPGDVLRLRDVVVTPGGKGLNVARAARALEVPAVLAAFLPGQTGRAVAEMIAAEGVTLDGIAVPGEIRSTSIILEPSGRTTVINEPGPDLPPDGWAELERRVAAALAAHGVLVCSGSLPPRAPADGYARLAALAREAGRPAVVDASGATLRAAFAARPDVVTPNLAEAEAVLHGRADEAVEAAPDARPRALAAAEALLALGPRAAVVTAAAAGAAVAGDAGADGSAIWVPAPRVRVRNPIGAGDVLAAGLSAALEHGAPLVEAARRGVAAAAASVEAPKAGELDPARMRDLLALVLDSGSAPS
jgi:1-phosphofructokinase family hexose kinase